jgi:hypothetical protein
MRIQYIRTITYTIYMCNTIYICVLHDLLAGGFAVRFGEAGALGSPKCRNDAVNASKTVMRHSMTPCDPLLIDAAIND